MECLMSQPRHRFRQREKERIQSEKSMAASQYNAHNNPDIPRNKDLSSSFMTALIWQKKETSIMQPNSHYVLLLRKNFPSCKYCKSLGMLAQQSLGSVNKVGLLPAANVVNAKPQTCLPSFVVRNLDFVPNVTILLGFCQHFENCKLSFAVPGMSRQSCPLFYNHH